MLQAQPGPSAQHVKGILMFTAQELALKDASGSPLSTGLSLLTQGAGSVNAAGAVEVARKIDTTKPRLGAAWLKATLSGQTTIAGETFAWGQQVIWARPGDLGRRRARHPTR